MNEQLRELYQEVIIDHGRHPRSFGELSNATHKLDGFNPLCGDKLTLFMKINGDIIEAIQFNGAGCAISVASASLMCEALKGKTLNHAKNLFKHFHGMVAEDKDIDESLNKLAVLAGVKEYPARVKCATLAWHTLTASIEGKDEAVSTE
jgi:nitrogen fixation protein NifU and related proteins